MQPGVSGCLGKALVGKLIADRVEVVVLRPILIGRAWLPIREGLIVARIPGYSRFGGNSSYIFSSVNEVLHVDWDSCLEKRPDIGILDILVPTEESRFFEPVQTFLWAKH